MDTFELTSFPCTYRGGTETTTFKLGGLPCTYSKTNQGNDASFQVVLPSGQIVELCSKKGAGEFIDTVGSYFISTNLTATGDRELMLAYMMMITVIQHASPEKIASGIPESELHTFIEHTLNTLDMLSTNRNWLRSGILKVYHELLLRVVARFLSQPFFLKIFLSNGGMEAVAKFYASRKKRPVIR
jgi:hypothetical protein